MRYSVLILSSVAFVGACGPLQWNSSILGPRSGGGSAPVAPASPSTVPAAPDVAATPLAPLEAGTTSVAPAPGTPATSAGYTGRATTVASLGDPSQPGLWMETPLVSSAQRARVRSPRGNEVVLTLRPIEGAAGAGSRLSIDAMRALGLPLTELVEVQVLPAG
ncbi:hypothetical protein MACH18_20560 [Phaeobacter italicus]|uniref:hypothetical protein n=1 Tax=Phaeobacter italicus TaxID=481446 RepID=UPI002774DD1C|nr:hypothetical protein [Phaeobacter italicus]GLO74976.1 hypothetical protein MACH18_20560 [Phaeobacter italicus]